MTRPRRSNGLGTISLRSDGRWQARLAVNGHRRTAYAKTEQEAQRKLLALQKQLAVTGSLPDPGRRTVNDLLTIWLETSAQTLKPKTLADYEKVSKYIRPTLGHIRLATLEPAHIQKLYTALPGNRVPTRVHSVLHRALKVAVMWGWLATNPADRTLKPTYSPERKEVWAADELARFLEGTEGHWLRPLWVVALATGCRLGELTGVKWADVDLTSRSITIKRTLQRIKGHWIEGTPKTKSGHRTITLPAEAIGALRTQHRQQSEWRLRAGADWHDTGLVFTNQQGAPLSPTTVEHAIKGECQRLELPPVTPHGLRHLHASLLLAQNLPITAVSSRLGHSNPAITMAVYAHSIKRQDEEAARVIGDLLQASR